MLFWTCIISMNPQQNNSLSWSYTKISGQAVLKTALFHQISVFSPNWFQFSNIFGSLPSPYIPQLIHFHTRYCSECYVSSYVNTDNPQSQTLTRFTEPGIRKMPSSFKPVASMCSISCTGITLAYNTSEINANIHQTQTLNIHFQLILGYKKWCLCEEWSPSNVKRRSQRLVQLDLNNYMNSQTTQGWSAQ